VVGEDVLAIAASGGKLLLYPFLSLVFLVTRPSPLADACRFFLP